MSVPEDETIRNLEHALTKAHRERQPPPLEQEWTDRVMWAIRRQEVRTRPVSTRVVLDRFIWQTASAAAALALILTLSLLVMSMIPPRGGISLVAEEVESGSLFLE